MDNVNILGTVPLDDELVKQIKGIDKRIQITNILDLIMSEAKDTIAKEKLDTLLADADILYGFVIPPNIVARAPKLKWLQMTSAGVDMHLTDEIIKSTITMTNVSGLHAIPVAEFVLCEMLMFAKGAPQCFQMKQDKQWKYLSFVPLVLHSKTVGIVGLGNIGREIARLSKAFGMRVLGVDVSVGRGVRNVDTVFPREQLSKMLAASDFVVLALPLTAETRKIIGEAELRSMKPTAYLINTSRGTIVDEVALIQALTENRIKGAGLDVFVEEPLPKTSPIWDLPNVIFSPHHAGGMEGYIEQATDMFCENLKLYLAGKKLLRVVDKEKGF